MRPDADDGYLYVCECLCVHVLHIPDLVKTHCHHSLHADSLILLALLPADCRCSLQAGLTFIFHQLLVYEFTPGPTDKPALSQLARTWFNASCLCLHLTEKETTMLAQWERGGTILINSVKKYSPYCQDEVIYWRLQLDPFGVQHE